MVKRIASCLLYIVYSSSFSLYENLLTDTKEGGGNKLNKKSLKADAYNAEVILGSAARLWKNGVQLIVLLLRTNSSSELAFLQGKMNYNYDGDNTSFRMNLPLHFDGG